MNEEVDDIYHQDFTTASEWEVFTARIEENLNEWKLSKSFVLKQGKQFTSKWTVKTEELVFQGIKFMLSYHSLETEKNIESSEETECKLILTNLHNGLWDSTKNFMDDGDGSPFPVSSWFGLKQYIMLCSNFPLVDGHLIKLIRSSVNIAFANVDCGVPFFIKIREHWQHTFLGLYEDREHKISYDVMQLKRMNRECSNLNALENLFKSKIASPVPLSALIISAKYSYELKDIEQFAWKKSTQSNEFLSIDGFDINKLIELPFGCVKNPIYSVLLNAIWPRFRERVIVDRASFSEIDSIMAPTWTINLRMRDEFDGQLSEIINKIMNLLDNNNLLMDVLGLSKSLGLVNPLHKITEPPNTISKLVKAAIGESRKVSDYKGPIADDLLMPLLYYIFPDAVEDDTFNYSECESVEVEFKQTDGEQKLCSYVKTSPKDGLVWRTSVTAARLYDAGGLPYLAHFWYEFVQELQYRWEHHVFVPGIAKGTPNARTCLLHQKLQLLNCCIKKALEGTGSLAGNSSEDEFFDCSEDEGHDDPGDQLPWNRPVGRLNRFEDATMKNGAPLYVPCTQDTAPKTEDQLEEDAELMLRLGEGAKASELRARMMSASLLSDMEAFKAANPGAELCDFVRWYSPRDWKPDNGGCLGDRMLLPGNPWVEAWNVARPVPAIRQRRLFDETREAEQVLHFLRSRTVSAVAELLLPAILRAGAEKAHKEGAVCTSTNIGGVDRRRTFEIAARELVESERETCRSICLRTVLDDSPEGKPLDANGRKRILNIAGGVLPVPVRREFTLRVKDDVAPQLMRAALAEDITIIGAFTERIVCL